MQKYFSKGKQELREFQIRALAQQLDTIDEQIKELQKSKRELPTKLWYNYYTYLRLRREMWI